MIRKILLILGVGFCVLACESDDSNSGSISQVSPKFTFSHDWDGTPVSSGDFNNFMFTTASGQSVSIERLRYVISDITFTTSSGEVLTINGHNLVDVTNDNGLSYTLPSTIPARNFTNVSFTFGLDNEDNSQNLTDLNSANFNVPDMLGGGYHYMQFDGEFINSSMNEMGFNYHVIRAVDNPGANPTFPQDTFFTVNLGAITISNSTQIEIKMNIAEWFKNPIEWDLNQYNQMLMPNSAAQIMMYNNGQSVFSLGAVTQETE